MDARLQEINDLCHKVDPRPINLAMTVQMIEELAELSQALTKSLRDLTGDKTLAPDTEWLKMIAEETADVQIMLERLIDFYKIEDAIEVFKNAKIERTLKRLSSLK